MSQAETTQNVSPGQDAKAKIRWMIRKDMPDVTAIEQENSEFPWSLRDFFQCLQDRSSIALVAYVDEDQIVGFMIYYLCYEGLYVPKLVVAKDWQDRGVDLALLEKLKTKIREGIRRLLVVEVKESQVDCFQQQGFTKTSMLLALRTQQDYRALQQSKLCIKKSWPENIHRTINWSINWFQRYNKALTVFLPDETHTLSIDWAMEVLAKAAKEHGKQKELGVVNKILEESKDRHIAMVSTKIDEVAAVALLTDSARFIRISEINIAPPWLERTTATKKFLLNELCQRASAEHKLLYAELKEDDLPLYQSFGFVPVARMMEYRA